MRTSNPIIAATLLLLGVGNLPANPTGMKPVAGTATATTSGSTLKVQVSSKAVLDWRTFNINGGETTTFIQPSAASIVWNRVNDPNPSRILGNLNANGFVVLANQAGFYFGPNAMVQAAGFVATTVAAPPANFGATGPWQFNGPPPTASIINYGAIQVAPGGALFLIAEQVENHGTLEAPQGNLGLYAGKEVLLSERPDGRGLSTTVRLPTGSVDNAGKIIADGGSITLQARVVNQGGLLQANSVRNDHGVIELLAGESVNLQAASVISARGDAQGRSDGGQVRIQSAGAYQDQPGARIDVAGGLGGGNGGQLEISAARVAGIQAKLNSQAASGYQGGSLLLDPEDMVISTGGSGPVAAGVVNAADPPTTLNLNVASSFQGFAQITLQASHNISLAAGTAWDLPQSTGHDEPGSRLSLAAGNDIEFQGNAKLTAGLNWTVSLAAGVDFANGNQVKSGQGSVRFAGAAALEAGHGDISVTAGKGVAVDQGFLHTTGGGNIAVTALAGSVNTGKQPGGYLFQDGGAGYSVDTANLGGVSTGQGGNVSITAGQDVVSYLPTLTGTSSDGGTGAFGPQNGDVTIKADGNVTGHYVVANGQGQIHAGNDAGLPNRLLALSLVQGSWEVQAGNSVYLQEVRNPNGVFNRAGFSTSQTKHLFDYDPQASVELKAQNSVNLLGSALPRNFFENQLPILYPPELKLEAGSGGVVLGNNVTLFPSPQGQLEITTTAGGSLQTVQANQSFAIGLSDSARRQWSQPIDFSQNDHSQGLLHLNDPNPVRLELAGSLRDVVLWTPKPAQLTVQGDVVNASFIGQNLHSRDVTAFHVGGDIRNRNNYTVVTLDVAVAPPDFTVFDRVFLPQPNFPEIDLDTLKTRFIYDPVTRTLALKQRLTSSEMQLLSGLLVQAVDEHGQLQVDRLGSPLYVSQPLVAPAVLQQLFTLSQDVPAIPPAGFQLGGPGKFQITAHDLDLGFTKGLVSVGPQVNPALAQLSRVGADMDIELAGSLSMFSSAIRSISGGNIHLFALGSVAVGSTLILGDSEVARGIYTSGKSDVEVLANGNIELNGSRIAAYDGGNVHVKSFEGSVDAGSGAQGFVRVEQVAADPVSGLVSTLTRPIPGSGILATTFPESGNAVGNITVETPRGSILANAGGIMQLSLNQNRTKAGVVTLNAGNVAADGTVIPGSIDAGNSGVIGSNVRINATKNVTGLIFSRQNIDIQARQNVSVTALAQGGVNLSAGGNVSGTVIGVSSVSVGGGSVSAALLSQNVNVGGSAKLSSSQMGFAPTAAASTASQSAQNKEADRITSATPKNNAAVPDAPDRNSTPPRLVRTVGRVTVILPNL